MANRKFEADATFEAVEITRKWALYKVSDRTRGQIGYFRLNRETGYCDDRDTDGVLQLGPWFGGDAPGRAITGEDFVDRFELLNWVYEAFEAIYEMEEPPKYHVVST
jgi:hypothetical protein